MKKNDCKEFFYPWGKVKKWLFLMKLIAFFLFAGLCQVSATAFGQRETVTFSRDAMTLEEIFTTIRKQLQYDIFYSNEELDTHQKIQLSARKMNVEGVLKEILKGKYSYEFIEKTIVIRPLRKIGVEQEQENVIKGKVVDVHGKPLPGVTIRVDSTSLGCSSNVDGEFELTLRQDKGHLVFSFIGFKTKRVAFTRGKFLSVTLEEEVTEMEEVIVNGMFTQNRNSYTGSVTTMKGEDILAVSNTNLLKAISVLSPGLRLVENNEMGSNPNYIPEIIIRGTTSIASQGEYGLNTPLIILDGVEISITQLYDLDIYEIERVDVLKDASATSIYGEKAANGVIVIERKKVTDKNIRVRYNFVPGFEFPDVDSYDYCNAAQKLELERLAGLYNTADGSLDESYNEKFKRIQKGADTDWMAKPLRNSTSFSHSLSMTGRGAGMDYGVTANFSDKRGVMKGDYRNNYGLSFYFSYRLVDRLTITYRADINKTDTKASPYGSFTEFVKINPYDTPFNAYGEWNKILSYDFRNPLYDASTSSFDKSESKTITNNLTLRWDIWKGFYLTGSFSYSLSDSQSDKFVSPDHSSFETETDPGKRGSYFISNMRGKSWQARIGLTYSKTLSDNGSILTLNVGANANKSNSNSNSFSGIGFLKGNLTDMAFANSYPTNGQPSGSESLSSSVGVFGNLNIIFLNRYFVDGSYRVSGSSKFGKDRRFAPFWSVGIGWNAHNESFLSDLGWFDIFRIRGSVGYTGSVNFSDYQAITTYLYKQDNNYLISMGALPITMGNDRLKWQTTVKYNVGATLEMWEGRLSANFDIYKEDTKDLLLSISTPPSMGVTNVMDNLGETRNWGYEWSLSGLLIKSNQLYWRMGLSGHHTENKLKKISNSMKRQNDSAMRETGVAAPKVQLEEGESSTAIYAVPSLGIDPATGQEIFIKKDGSYTFSYDVKDKVALGNTVPFLQGALTTSVGYKGFSISAAMTFTFGGDIYNTTRASKVERINPQENVDVRAFTERCKKPGDVVHYTALTDTKSYVHSERFIERKNEVFLSSLNFSYEFKREWVKKIGLNKLRIGVGFSDVLRMSTVKYERGTAYPYSKGYNFTISPTF